MAYTAGAPDRGVARHLDRAPFRHARHTQMRAGIMQAARLHTYITPAPLVLLPLLLPLLAASCRQHHAGPEGPASAGWGAW